jgi:hypothetical protein
MCVKNYLREYSTVRAESWKKRAILTSVSFEHIFEDAFFTNKFDLFFVEEFEIEGFDVINIFLNWNKYNQNKVVSLKIDINANRSLVIEVLDCNCKQRV